MKKKVLFILAIAIISIIIICIIIMLKPYYEISDRTDELNTFRYISGEKATGWLRVQGTNIDIAILNNNDGPDIGNPNYNIGWTNGESSFNYDRMVIYSHNMKNVSNHPLITNKDHKRFEQLMSFIYYDFAKDNEYIQYTVKDKNELYKIYAIYLIDNDYLSESQGKISKNSRKEYIKNALDRSYFNYDVNVNNNDKLLTLVTCTRFYGASSDYSFVVDARKLRKNESIKKYGVTKDKKYDKIEVIVEGDVDNG